MLTTVIQNKIILSITIFFRSTSNENIIVTKKVLQAGNLKKQIPEYISLQSLEEAGGNHTMQVPAFV